MLHDVESLLPHTQFLFSTRSTSSWRPPWGDQSGAEQGDQDLLGSRGHLLPPTLIASIYGMNFGRMPELAWEYGYPLLVLMVMSSLGTGLFFKRKGWL